MHSRAGPAMRISIIEEPPPGGDRDGLELGVASELAQDRADVVSDRRFRQPESGTDLPRPHALGQQEEHLPLTLAQLACSSTG